MKCTPNKESQKKLSTKGYFFIIVGHPNYKKLKIMKNLTLAIASCLLLLTSCQEQSTYTSNCEQLYPDIEVPDIKLLFIGEKLTIWSGEEESEPYDLKNEMYEEERTIEFNDIQFDLTDRENIIAFQMDSINLVDTILVEKQTGEQIVRIMPYTKYDTIYFCTFLKNSEDVQLKR